LSWLDLLAMPVRSVMQSVSEVLRPVSLPAPVRPSAPPVSPAPSATKATARDASATAAFTLLARLRAHGLRGVERIVLTRNRSVMVSVSRGTLRVHAGFVQAPDDVLRAVATFATTRDRAARRRAQAIVVGWPLPSDAVTRTRRATAQHPDDAGHAQRLTELHGALNLEHFGGALTPLEVRVSRRLARRLGHYSLRGPDGPGEIVLSRRHIRRDGWAEATHTLLHEMVHQWQDEGGLPVDHGPGFRRKCRAVGIHPGAVRLID
jgi:hypothetical protein